MVFIRPAGEYVKKDNQNFQHKHAQVGSIYANRKPGPCEIEKQDREEHHHARKHEAVIPHTHHLGLL